MIHLTDIKVFGIFLKVLSKFLLLAFCLANILSCTNATLYEIKSPCVSIDSANPYFRAPCTKRPANELWDIS
ncbi:MAG: DUF2706 domain-containing protein [Rickettsiaceae bacterium]|nr:DUF2706 domain-containing protein [Rickettsiaceae bacterium]